MEVARVSGYRTPAGEFRQAAAQWLLAASDRLTLFLIVLIFAGHLALLASLPDAPATLTIRRMAFAVEGLLASIALFSGARNALRFSERHYNAWSLLALAPALYALGKVVDFVNGLGHRPVIWPATAVLLSLLYYPVFLSGILLFPFRDRLGWREWLKVFMDVATLLCGLFVLTWTLLIGPLLESGLAAITPGAISGLAYPLGDLLLLSTLLSVLLRQHGPQTQKPLWLLASAVAVLLLVRTAMAEHQLVGRAQHLLEAAEVVACAITLWAGMQQTSWRAARGRCPASRRRITAWQLICPFASLLSAYVLLVWRWGHDGHLLGFVLLAFVVGVIMMLVTARLVITTLENAQLYNHVLDANADLEKRVEQRTALLESTNKELNSELRSKSMLQASLRETNCQLQKAVKAQSEMIHNTSHELRTPLTLILAYAELLQDRQLGPLEAEQSAAVEVIGRQGERLLFMVSRLLTMQSFEPSKLALQPVDIAEWLSQVVAAWQPKAAQGHIALYKEIVQPLPTVMVDCEYLRHVLDNLLDNAVKFTQQGGMIQVRAWGEQARLLLVVSDNGIGIAPEKRDQLFQRFYQIDGSINRSYGGLGIGLSLCQMIVTAHHGRIWVESGGEEQGTAFYVELPAVEAPLAAVPWPELSASAIAT